LVPLGMTSFGMVFCPFLFERRPPPPVKTGERLYTQVQECVQACVWRACDLGPGGAPW